jgi:outer membrane autotransporter protein
MGKATKGGLFCFFTAALMMYPAAALRPAAAAPQTFWVAVESSAFSYDSADHLQDQPGSLNICTNTSTPDEITSYTVNAELRAADRSEYGTYLPEYWSHMLYVNGHNLTQVSNVNINVTGKVVAKLRNIDVRNGDSNGYTINFNDVVINTDVENAFEDDLLEVTNIRISSATANIHNLYLNSQVDFNNAPEAAHNGVYAMKESGLPGIINLTGDIYINTNISSLAEVYDGEYGIGVSKNDAVSGKYGGHVYINTDENGTVLSRNSTIQIFGNVDVKGGEVIMALSGSNSFWQGALVGAIQYDTTTHTYGDLRTDSNFQLILADGAQWVPDIMPVDDGGTADAKSAYISNVRLEEGGIINMHGLNKHTLAPDTVDNLVIYNLESDGGILRIDATGSPVHEGSRNESDFITIRSGSGLVYVQPLDGMRLNGVSATNPVRIADAAEGITMTGLQSTSGFVEGTLYDYTPIIEKNVVSTRYGEYGNDWYIVGVEQENNNATDTGEDDDALRYALTTSHHTVDMLNQRLGEIREYGSAAAGAWFRWKGGKIESDKYGSYSYKWNYYQLGGDRTVTDADGTWYYGAALHGSGGDTDYRHGSGSVNGLGASVYASRMAPSGWYADFIAYYTHVRNDIDISENLNSASARYNTGIAGFSAEYGRKYDLKNNWFIEPQVQLVYSFTPSLNYRYSNGIEVNEKSISSLIGRAGFRFGRSFYDSTGLKSQLYVKLNVYHEFSGDRNLGMIGTDGSLYSRFIDSSDTWVIAGIGGSTALGKNLFLYADVERSFGGDIDVDWQINAGLRWFL